MLIWRATGATVVPALQLGWKTRGLAGAQNEPRDLRAKLVTIGGDEIVVAFHVAFARFEDAKTLVLMNATGLNYRLFADYAFTFDLDVLARRIVDEPSS